MKRYRIKVAKQYGVKNIFNSHEELIKSNLKLDAVVIITKRTMTGPISYDFLKSGYNIFTEKPMCCSTDQAKKILKIQKNKKLIFTVGYNKRFDTGVIKFKKKLRIKKKHRIEKLFLLEFIDLVEQAIWELQKNIKV